MATPPSLIQSIFNQAFNQGDLAIVDELVAVGSVTHLERWGLSNDRKGFKDLISSLRTAFPDLVCAIEDEIHEGDKFAANWTIHGTHQGLFLGNPPTGKPVAVQGLIFARLADGMIVEHWMLIDQFGLLQQLGIIPH
jgi:steroid delta-isomerase-like uncharacterized protein